MGDKSAIEWTDATWNPTTGCDRVSPGCDNCYALTLAKRLKGMGQARYQRDGDPRTSGPGFGLTQHDDALALPLRWTRPRRVFVNSMSDLYHPDVSIEFIGQVYDVMAEASRHTFQVLTKRPQRAAGIMPGLLYRGEDGGWRPLPNVWLGTSIESDRYTFRADHLRATAAAVRFLSLEPLLGPLPSLDLTGIDWVIVGGESGPGARPMHPDWARDIRDRCQEAGIAFHFKQWGAWSPERPEGWGVSPDHRSGRLLSLLPDGSLYDGSGPSWQAATRLYRHGLKAKGRHLDGRTWDEFPERTNLVNL